MDHVLKNPVDLAAFGEKLLGEAGFDENFFFFFGKGGRITLHLPGTLIAQELWIFALHSMLLVIMSQRLDHSLFEAASNKTIKSTTSSSPLIIKHVPQQQSHYVHLPKCQAHISVSATWMRYPTRKTHRSRYPPIPSPQPPQARELQLGTS